MSVDEDHSEVLLLRRELAEARAERAATIAILSAIREPDASLETVLALLIRSAIELCGGARGVVWILQDGVLVLGAHVGYPDDWVELARSHPIAPAPDSPTVSGRVAFTGEVSNVADLPDDPRFSSYGAHRLGDYRGSLSAPLMQAGEVVGVIGLTRPEPGLFTDRQVSLLRHFADHAVIAIENKRLVEQVSASRASLQKALDGQTAIADGLKTIGRSAFEIDVVLTALIDTAVRLCRGARGTIYLLEGDELVASAFHSNVPAALRDHLKATRYRLHDDRPMTEAVRLGQVTQVANPEATPAWKDRSVFSLARFGSMLYVPLLRDGQPLGCMAMPRETVDPFSAEEMRLVQAFADQAVIAIGNTRLFEEVRAKTHDLQEALRQQTATADVLKVISRSAFDLDLAASTILSAAASLCRASMATLHLRQGAVCRLAAQVGMPEAFVRIARENHIPAKYPLHSRRVARAGEVAHFPDSWSDPEYLYKDTARMCGYRAVVVVPLMREDELIGLFSLARPDPEAFSDSQIKLIQTFADQAAIAIENARLFRETQESLRQQTATADVLKVISRSAFDLESVLSTLIRSAADLCSVQQGLIFVGDGQAQRLGAAVGFPAESVDFFRANPRRPGRESIVPRVLLSRRVEQIPDILQDPEYALPVSANPGQTQALLAVPLLRDGEIEGVFVLARREPGRFSDRHVELVQTFADQAVIAMRNARLFNEVQQRTQELAASLHELRTAQDRLIQTEKLASLGQLTAGIAHEIKNPLNFVNNFAALSAELVDELIEVLAPVSLADSVREEVSEIGAMLKGNLEKVASHGRRADSIVKNMLLHSRGGSGERRLVDINALAEESLNLAYHGVRAEVPGFNVDLERRYDPEAGQADLFPQEITRVLLNLMGNGFYAVRKRAEAGETGYEPRLTIETRGLPAAVEIRITDNGTGIPESVRQKMFDPFFTTKPAGEGTGLGLSLSHDIVVKQHKGEIRVESSPGLSTAFTITLPRSLAAVDLSTTG